MSKIERKLQKNIKKRKEQQKKEYPLKNQVLTLSKILYGILLLIIVVAFISALTNKNYKLDDEDPNTDYKEILASQTFSRSEDTYYVVFYKEDDIKEKVDEISSETVYKVDLNSLLNKDVLAEESNKNASTSDELKIKETTLIMISDSKNELFIEGYDEVLEYLNRF